MPKKTNQPRHAIQADSCRCRYYRSSLVGLRCRFLLRWNIATKNLRSVWCRGGRKKSSQMSQIKQSISSSHPRSCVIASASKTTSRTRGRTTRSVSSAALETDDLFASRIKRFFVTPSLVLMMRPNLLKTGFAPRNVEHS